MLLLSALVACSVRAPHTQFGGHADPLPEPTVRRLLLAWQEKLGRYLAHEGRVDPAMLSQTRVLRSRDVPRPARIVFGVLDVEASIAGRDGWDVQGVLVGKHMSGAHSWYVFVVGIVERAGYRPSSIRDIRLVALSVPDGTLAWKVGVANPQALQRYREAIGSAGARFPADLDRFSMSASEEGVSVTEAQSGGHWSLPLGRSKSTTRVESRCGTTQHLVR